MSKDAVYNFASGWGNGGIFSVSGDHCGNKNGRGDGSDYDGRRVDVSGAALSPYDACAPTGDGYGAGLYHSTPAGDGYGAGRSYF